MHYSWWHANLCRHWTSNACVLNGCTTQTFWPAELYNAPNCQTKNTSCRFKKKTNSRPMRLLRWKRLPPPLSFKPPWYMLACTVQYCTGTADGQWHLLGRPLYSTEPHCNREGLCHWLETLIGALSTSHECIAGCSVFSLHACPATPVLTSTLTLYR